jgi:hypothetical protein
VTPRADCTLSGFTNPAHGRRVYQVMQRGMPLTAEIADRDEAVRKFSHFVESTGGYVRFWDGDLGEHVGSLMDLA